MNRRDAIKAGGLFVAGAGVFGADQIWGNETSGTGESGFAGSTGKENMKLPFKLSVITDEISQDFGHAAEIAAQEFGLGYIEIRTLWKKNIVNLDEKELAEVRRIVDKYRLLVTDIGSPLFKISWPLNLPEGPRGECWVYASFKPPIMNMRWFRCIEGDL